MVNARGSWKVFGANPSFVRALVPLLGHNKGLTQICEVLERVKHVLREADPDHVNPPPRGKRGGSGEVHTVTNLRRHLAARQREYSAMRVEKERKQRANLLLACRIAKMPEMVEGLHGAQFGKNGVEKGVRPVDAGLYVPNVGRSMAP